MTKREKMIVIAYTGYLLADNVKDFRDYAEGVLKRPIDAHEMFINEFWKELREKLKPDFKEIMSYTDPERCHHKDGDYVKIGEHDIDPCLYEEIERHYNCNVIVSRCKRCGNIDISWTPGENYWCAEDLG